MQNVCKNHGSVTPSGGGPILTATAIHVVASVGAAVQECSVYLWRGGGSGTVICASGIGSCVDGRYFFNPKPQLAI